MSTASNPSCTPEELMAALQKFGEDPTAERVIALQPLLRELKPRDGWAHDALIMDAVRVARMRLWASTMPYPKLVDVIGTDTKNEPISTDALLFEGDRLFLGAGFKDIKHQPVRPENVTSIDFVSIPLSAGDHLGIDEYEVVKGDALTIDDFAHAQSRIEGLDMSFAMGQDLPFHDSLREQLGSALDAAPWMIDMDSGKIVAKNWEVEPVQVSPYARLNDEQKLDRLLDVQGWGPDLTVRLMRSFLRENGHFEKMLSFAEHVAANANLAGIREGDAELERRVAKAFGYESAAAMSADSAVISGPNKQELRAALSEIAESLDGLGGPITVQSIEDDYIARARYLSEVAVGKREAFAPADEINKMTGFFSIDHNIGIDEGMKNSQMSAIYRKLPLYGIERVEELSGHNVLKLDPTLVPAEMRKEDGFVMGPISTVVVKHGVSVRLSDGQGKPFILEPADDAYKVRALPRESANNVTSPEI